MIMQISTMAGVEIVRQYNNILPDVEKALSEVVDDWAHSVVSNNSLSIGYSESPKGRVLRASIHCDNPSRFLLFSDDGSREKQRLMTKKIEGVLKKRFGNILKKCQHLFIKKDDMWYLREEIR